MAHQYQEEEEEEQKGFLWKLLDLPEYILEKIGTPAYSLLKIITQHKDRPEPQLLPGQRLLVHNDSCTITLEHEVGTHMKIYKETQPPIYRKLPNFDSLDSPEAFRERPPQLLDVISIQNMLNYGEGLRNDLNERGTSKSQMALLKPTNITECAICMQPGTEGLKMTCGHGFHTECLKGWLKHKDVCPLCRAKLEMRQ